GASTGRTLFDRPRLFPDVEALILDSDCPANPGASCVGRHGPGGKDGVCPLLYRVLKGRVIGRGGTQDIRPELLALLCGAPDATAGGCFVVVQYLPGSVCMNVPLKPRLTPEIRQALDEATGKRVD